jgi:hypothetical protein
MWSSAGNSPSILIEGALRLLPPAPTVRSGLAEKGFSMTSNKRSFRWRLAAGASIVATALALGASPASSHPSSISLGRDSASIDAAHSRINVCNVERDGRAVRADVRTITGDQHSYTDPSENGICTTSALAPGARQWRLCRVSSTVVVCTSYRPV